LGGASLAGMQGIRAPSGGRHAPGDAQPAVTAHPAAQLAAGTRALTEAAPACGVQAAPGEPIGEIGAALHSLTRSLKRGRLHDFLLAQARVDADQAGLAILYVLHLAGANLRLCDLAEQLRIDAPAVTRKAQQLERSGLVSRTQDLLDARATRIQLTAQGRRTISRFLAARRTWLTSILADWSDADRADLARLLGRFADDMHRRLEELDD
jgi:DNA-binding MarR family transcriptional regulator